MFYPGTIDFSAFASYGTGFSVADYTAPYLQELYAPPAPQYAASPPFFPSPGQFVASYTDYSIANSFGYGTQQSQQAPQAPPPQQASPFALQTYSGPYSSGALSQQATAFSHASPLTNFGQQTAFGNGIATITQPIVLTAGGQAQQLPATVNRIGSTHPTAPPQLPTTSFTNPTAAPPTAIPIGTHFPTAIPATHAHPTAVPQQQGSVTRVTQVVATALGPQVITKLVPTAQPPAVPVVEHQQVTAIVQTLYGPQTVHMSIPIVAPQPVKPAPPRDEQVIKRSFNFSSQTWSESVITVRIDTTRPISSGTFRTAYHMVDHSRALNDRHMVAKIMHANLFKPERVEGEVKTLAFCEYLAQNFNLRAPLKPVHFVEAYVIYRNRDDLPAHERVVAVEQFLDGRFEKYNDNDGWYGDRRTPQAFTHFTYQATGGRLMVVDMQGVGNVYTDPQIHSVDRVGFGAGNCGLVGMRKFFDSHRCNDVCRFLLLPHHEGKNAPVTVTPAPVTALPVGTSVPVLLSHIAI
eukprot:TRINITY_DN53960_c0_g1_i1.p1 TRINITY_DN53960_c0_g1~~TRINITY_DN53960_c0_g1_i1.p1  ORF type:complete len:551 (-),score=115.80 TRINITY_DN53960_c0_g1_i1:201-1763(-)